MFISILGGIFSSVVRIITSMCFSLMGLARLDEPLFPQWVMNILYLDAGNQAFLSMIFMYHLHNNPIHITFGYLLCILFIYFI